MFFSLFLIVMAMPLFSCPRFVEFLPDPIDVSDEIGEFIEIRLDFYKPETLFVSFDEKEPLKFFVSPNTKRFLLVHDTLECIKRNSVSCGYLGKYSLPNSRESVWKLWSKSCMDSAFLPSPKSGKSLQRVKETDNWVVSDITKGYANPEYELNLNDCGIKWKNIEWLKDIGWRIRGFLSGCDSIEANYSELDLLSGLGWKHNKIILNKNFEFEIKSKGPIWVSLILPEDDAPINDTLDSFFSNRDKPPVVISEVHHCPNEPMPEWVEIYNTTRYSIPLSRLHFCGKGSFFGGFMDSLQPYESMLISKDSLLLRSSLGFYDVNIRQISFGYLNNITGNLLLCLDSSVIDSVSWNKKTVNCPSGFNPIYGKSENTPGYQRFDNKTKYDEPFSYKLSSRIVSKKGYPLRISVVSEFDVNVRLLDSTGHKVWSTQINAYSNSWQTIPIHDYCKIGVSYVSVSVGSFEKVVGIVVRP